MKRSLLPLVAVGLVLAMPLTRAATDYFLEIDGIDGESVDTTRPRTIEVASWSFGANNSGSFSSGGGGGSGKVSFQDFHFTTTISKASPQLLLSCATGKHIPKATLFVRKSGATGPVEYYKITLEDLLVSSIAQDGGSSSGGTTALPMESVSLNFAKITFDYTTADGTVVSGSAIRTPTP